MKDRKLKNFPLFCPEMQDGNANQCETTEYIRYKRVRRKDAESIICEQSEIVGSFQQTKRDNWLIQKKIFGHACRCYVGMEFHVSKVKKSRWIISFYLLLY